MRPIKIIQIILICAGIVILLFTSYCVYAINWFIYFGNTKIPNMTIELKNNSNYDIKYEIVIGNKSPIKGYLKQNRKSQIKVVYSSNLDNMLHIKIFDEDDNLICETRPTLNIIRQHIYNPKIQYKLEATFRDDELQVIQIK